MNGVRVFWQQRRIREETRVEKSRKEMKQGYEGRLYSPPPLLFQEKVRSCSWRTSFETMSGTSLPFCPHISPPLLLFPLSSLFFPRVPRDAFRAPCLVIRVMYGALIALRRPSCDEIDHITIRAHLLTAIKICWKIIS